MSGLKDSGTGKPVPQSGTHEAAHVVVGVAGQARNRNINAASSTYLEATNSATWPTGIRETSITPLVTTTQQAAQDGKACLVVYDAPNGATAATMLADPGSAGFDVQYDLVLAGETLTRQHTAAITRIDVLPIGAGNTVMRVLVGAV